MVYFKNYEIHKMIIDNPDLINYVILTILVLVYLSSLRKGETEFLDKIHTDQLRSLAIIFVAIGHLWVHVSRYSPLIVLSGDGVTLFFILSGFGLSKSDMKSGYTLKQFLIKRFNRVFISYWISTVIILTLDYLFLNNTYGTQDILLTFSGINISSVTRHLDYVRWFITFLLFWYVIFFFSTKLYNRFQKVFLFFLTAVFVFPFDYYITHFGWYQIFAFPTGVFWAYYYKEIKDMIDKQSLLFYIFLPVIGIIAVVSYKMFLWEVFEMNLPSIIYKAVSEGFSLLFSVSFILLLGFIGSKNKVSKLFAFGGVFAYELFLLHGPFLIKYNPILSKENIVFSFYCWLVAIIGLSYIFYKLASFPKKWGEILE